MASQIGRHTLGCADMTDLLPEQAAPAPQTHGRFEMVRRGAERRPLVLIVEDDPNDADFTRWAFEECRGQVELRFVDDGAEALEYLVASKGPSDAERRTRPCLILLDLRIPKGGGFRLLRTIRDDLVLRTIPVVIFTGSDAESDVARAYELGANSYFTKPDTMDGYRNIIRIIEAYWLRKAELPPSLL